MAKTKNISYTQFPLFTFRRFCIYLGAAAIVNGFAWFLTFFGNRQAQEFNMPTSQVNGTAIFVLLNAALVAWIVYSLFVAWRIRTKGIYREPQIAQGRTYLPAPFSNEIEAYNIEFASGTVEIIETAIFAILVASWLVAVANYIKV